MLKMFKMSDKVYNRLSKVQRWLPALGTFALGICTVWKIPLGDEINQTIVLVATLMAATLEIATAEYRKKNSENV